MTECPCPSCRNVGPDHEDQQDRRGTTPASRPVKANPFLEWWSRRWDLNLIQARTQYAKEPK